MKLRPLAIYTNEKLKPENINELSNDLSDWYFSNCGGLLITERVRSFYFELQKLLQLAATLEWECTHRPSDPKAIFSQFVENIRQSKHQLKPIDLESIASIKTKDWRELCVDISEELQKKSSEKDPKINELIFSVLQQAASVLRTTLADELDTRLKINTPSLLKLPHQFKFKNQGHHDH